MDFHGEQFPIAISLSYLGNNNDKVITKFFIINKLKLVDGLPDKTDLIIEIDLMWNNFFNFIKDNNSDALKTIFVHNLGGFDGVFIFKQLTKLQLPLPPTILMDDSNKYIRISMEFSKDLKVKWVDSYRIFPISLENLCETFGIKGKTQKYDIRFNSFELFNKPTLFKSFKYYAMQDSKCLINALVIAQIENYNKFKIDITSCLSASSLAMKIYRNMFQKIDIPILKKSEDRFIRDSYYGGATDVYKAVVNNLFYIDVNSLYPKAMLNYMPLVLLEVINNKLTLSKLDLGNFFGFLKVEVYCPPSVKRPVLPVKFEGRTIFPTGTWIGTYFSEEIKAVLKLDLGYKIRIIEAHSYSKDYLFKEFVEYFFEIKRTSVGASKFLAKLCLNSLYGMFGRKQNLSELLIVNNDTLISLSVTKVINKLVTIIPDKLYLVGIEANINSNILNKLNSVLDTNITSPEIQVNSNVAIASAVTSYARIFMMQYKLLDCVAYTDTDSFFVTDLKPFLHLISDKLGEFKEELNGLIISKAIFLGLKQYGYQYLNKDGNLITKTVFAGIQRDSLSFDQIESLLNGAELKIDNGNRFYRSLTNLNIKIKPITTTIKQNIDKKLVNNEYLPKNIEFITKG